MNIIEFLKQTKIAELDLPIVLQDKLRRAGFATIKDVYSLVQSYKSCGLLPGEGFPDSDMKLLSIRMTELMVSKQVIKAPSAKQGLPAIGPQSSMARDSVTNTVTQQQNISKNLGLEPNQHASSIGLHRYPEPVTLNRPTVIPNEQALLMNWEARLTPQLRQVQLVGEISVSKENLEDIGKSLAILFHRSTSQACLDWIERNCPVTYAVFLVGKGIYGYNGGDYWASVQKVLRLENEAGLGKTFETVIHKFGLPLFPELQRRALKYVSLILAHGGIPVYCLPDFFANIVLPCTTRPQYLGLEGQDLIEEMLGSVSIRTITDQPVLHFLEYGGRAAEDLFERSRKVMRMRLSGIKDFDSDSTGLPTHIVDAFNEWAVDIEKRQPTATSSERRRIRKPELCLDPWGMGVFMRLPSQVVSPTSAQSISWTVEMGGRVEKPRVRAIRQSESYETNEAMLRLLHAASQVVVTFQVGGQDYEWQFPGITKERPILAFDSQTGLFLAHISARAVWLLYSAECSLVVSEGEGKRTEVLPRLPGDWAGFTAECWDLTQAEKLLLIRDDQPLVEIMVRAVDRSPEPFLFGGTLVRTDLGPHELPVYSGQPPALIVPVSGEVDPSIELDRWRLTMTVIGEEEHEGPRLRNLGELIGGACRIEVGTARIDLGHPVLLGNHPVGIYEIGIHGPLGKDASFRFGILPECVVEGISPLYCPTKDKGAQEVRFNVLLGLLDQLERSPSGQASVMPLSSGCFSIIFPSYSIDEEFTVLREGIDRQIVRVPLRLKVNRLRWRWIGSSVDGQWLDRLTDVPVPVFLQEQSPSLLVDLPIEGEENPHLHLRLIDMGGKEIQVIRPETRAGKHRGRYWRFDLDCLRDTLRGPISPILRLELCGSELPDVGEIQLPVLSFSREVNLKGITVDFYQVADSYRVLASWQEPFPVQSRKLYLWSIFRPWLEPIEISVPDEARGVYEFKIPREKIIQGVYRLSFAIVDPWINPPPPSDPPRKGSPGTVEVEFTKPEQRLRELERHCGGSLDRLGTQLSDRIESYIIHQYLAQGVGGFDKDIEWCCTNMYAAAGREILTIRRLLRLECSRNLRDDFSKRVMEPKVVEKLIAEITEGGISIEEFQEICELLPPAESWPDDTCRLFSHLEEPGLALPALGELVHRDFDPAFDRIWADVRNLRLSIEDAAELLCRNKRAAMRRLGNLPESDQNATRLLTLVEKYNLYSGLPIVSLGSWIKTNAGWARIEGIENRLTGLSVESFIEGETDYRLVTIMHIHDSHDLKGEKVIVDIASGSISFFRAARVFVCDRCREFATAKVDTMKLHMDMAHGGACLPPRLYSTQVKLEFIEYYHNFCETDQDK